MLKRNMCLMALIAYLVYKGSIFVSVVGNPLLSAVLTGVLAYVAYTLLCSLVAPKLRFVRT